jgi:hypothetical protein
MRGRTISVVCCGLALLVVSGCQNWLSGLITTRVVVRGQGESLRDQILGSYQRMGAEVYAMAGVRSVDPVTGEVKPAPEMTESQQRALNARRRMEFNRDDIRWFKREGYVGESYRGRLVFLDDPGQDLLERDPWLHDLVQGVVEEENSDRAVIVERLLRTAPELEGKSGRRTIWRVLARKYRADARPGTITQREDGVWVRKGE